MPDPTFWHIQLNPDVSLGRKKVVEILEKTSLIGLNFEKGSSTYNNFKDRMQLGDIVLVRDGIQPIALVEVTGKWEQIINPDEDLDWFSQRRKIRVLEYAAQDRPRFPKAMGTLERLVGNTDSRKYVEEWYKSLRGDHMTENAIALLKANLQLILTGAPGTGKTHLAREIAASIIGCKSDALEKSNRFKFVQFHPSFDYSDFVEGLKPRIVNGQVDLELKDGIFKEFCKRAGQALGTPFVFVIDEINRADLSRVFGELFYAIEQGYRGKPLSTQYSYITKSDFTVPENVFIIGTMNDIDRSVESIDFALRRRFAWLEIEATEELFNRISNNLGEQQSQARARYAKINAAIRDIPTLGKAYQIGPAYFRKLENYRELSDPFEALWDNHLLVLIREYVRGLPDAADIENALKSAYFS